MGSGGDFAILFLDVMILYRRWPLIGLLSKLALWMRAL